MVEQFGQMVDQMVDQMVGQIVNQFGQMVECSFKN